MASDEERDNGPNASSTVVPKVRMRRRVRHRKGPPQLRFVTATNPSDFKGEVAKRSVRSQAMIQYRYQSAEQKNQNSKGTPSGQTPPRIAERVVPINHHVYETKEGDFFLPWHSNSKIFTDSPSPEGLWEAPNQYADADYPWLSCPTDLVPVYLSRCPDATETVPLNAAAKQAIDASDGESNEAELLGLLFTTFPTTCVGSNMDPFSVLPQFATPELNSRQLVRNCNRVFVTKQTLARWVPAMLAHPHILLSSTIMSSTWRDMVEGVCGESRRTILLKAEIISWINERLRNTDTMFRDDTIMVILHLLVGETWSCNEKTLKIHMSGLARLVSARVNKASSFDAIGLATAIVSAHVPIICESIPSPQLCQFQASELDFDDFVALPENPLYCPREQMFSVISDPACSVQTYNLLCDVRDLTDLFLTYSDNLVNIFGGELEVDHNRLQTLSLDYDAKVTQFRTRLASLPSAYEPGFATTNDWIYEACRLTAVIQASAIITCSPFSMAADPSLNAVVRSGSSVVSERLRIKPPPRLTESLYEALERTNTGDSWNSMVGVFYWVCAVGAAAARTPVTINSYSRPSCNNEAYSTWVRRCLTMFSSRTLSQMIFEHPLPLLATQRKLLRVQELIGRNAVHFQAM